MNISLKYSYEINYKNIFLSTLAAFLLHLILIPIIDLLPKSPLEEEIEPKIILDLLEEEIVPTPSDNKITKPQLEEIIPPVETLKNIEPIPRVNQAIIEKNTNTPIPIDNNKNIINDIEIPIKPEQQTIENIINTHIPIENNKNIISDIKIPIKPEQQVIENIINNPIKPVTIDPLVEEMENNTFIKENNLNTNIKINKTTEHKEQLEIKPIINEALPAIPPLASFNQLDKIPKNQEYQYTVDRTPVLPQILPAVPRQENIVKEDLNTNSEDTLNKQILSEYNELIRSKIKQYAIRNYPTKSIKRGQEGTVFLKFILNENGYLTDIKIGDKTEASIALINAAKDSIEKNSPYKFDQKLKKKNEFSIVIVYKID